MSVEIDDALRYYLSTRCRSGAAFGAFLGTGDRHILSFSPELFFHLDGGMIETRPMKGTRRRGASPAQDRRLVRSLASDLKERAKNLMIVDLLRNDLSRVCLPGSVEVPCLFRVERYPTVWQMTSTVRGRIRTSLSALDVLASLFPCGSITGAPKIMAMKVIDDLERSERGAYTGAIGRISRDEAVFNVAIRTIDLVAGSGRLNVGAGIVADSKPRAEWLESLSKARFGGIVKGCG